MSTEKRKHETASLEVKAQILQRLDAGEKLADVAKCFNINRGTVYSIQKNKNKIMEFVKNAESGLKSRQTMKTGEFKDVETALYRWFLQERHRNSVITADVLKQKALSFYSQIYGKEDFQASDGWLAKFKARHGIRLLSISGEKVSSDHAAVEPFVQMFKKRIEELGLTAEQVYNADETGLFWKMLPRQTYVHRNEAGADGRKVPKDRITIMPCANAAGTHKLELLVIGKSKHPRALKNINLPARYKSQNKAWMTKLLFVDWFHQDFVPEVRRFLKSKNLPPKALLLLDNAPGHDPKENLTSKDGLIITLFLPANCTALIQPMDNNVILSLKTGYKKKVLFRIINQDSDFTQSMKQLTIKDAIFTAVEAWDEVSPEVIRSSWKKVWPSAENCDEEHPWEPEDEIPLATLIQETVHGRNSEVTPTDIEEWFAEDGSFAHEALTDEEILKEIEQEGNEEAEEDEVRTTEKAVASVKSDNALVAIQTSIDWAEQNSAAASTLLTLRKLKESVMWKIYRGKKQSKIDDFFIQDN